MVGDQEVKSGRLGFISQTMGDHWSFYGRFYFYMNSIFLFMNNLVGTQTLEADTRWKKKKIRRLYINSNTNSFHDTIVLLGFIK